MTYSATAYRLLVSAPGDIPGSDLQTIAEAISRWNVVYGSGFGVVVVPLHWSQHAAAEHGARPQQTLNDQLVDDADIVIATFWHRLGTPTGTAPSGTVEELTRAHDAGAHVAILRCVRSVDPKTLDTKQLEALDAFAKEQRGSSLMLEYGTESELKGHVEAILMRAVTKAGAAAEQSAQQPYETAGSVWPRIERSEHVKQVNGQPKSDTRWHLVLKNTGNAPVRDVHHVLEREQPDDDLPFQIEDVRGLEVLPPGGEAWYELHMHLGVAPQARCVVTWSDDDGSHENTATLRFF